MPASFLPRLGVLALTAAFLPAATPTSAPAKDTLSNLQAAYNGESNARASYLAFAEKAKAEGYAKAAALFTAAAKAEEIHAGNHAVVIKKMGGVPKADVKAPKVGTTLENLQGALKGESYERDTMYPEFLARARKDGNADAIQTLNLARNAEIEHAKLYQQALNNLDGWKAAGSTFYVCPVCGWTSLTLPAERCPSSFTPKGRFTSFT